MRSSLKWACVAALSVVVCAPLAQAKEQAFALQLETPKATASAARNKLLPVTLTLSTNAKDEAAQVAQIVESAVRRSKTHGYVDPFETYDPEGVLLRSENRRKADDALEFGRRQYEQLEERQGIESFNRAIDLYEESALWKTFDELVDAKVMRLLVTWPRERTIGRREIAELVAIAPSVEFPPDFTSPELALDVERAKNAAEIETKASLDVRSEPVAARVYVDGIYRGTSPTTVHGLAPGEHYVSFVAAGYDVVQRKVPVRPGATATETLVRVKGAHKFLSFLDRMTDSYRDPEEVAAAQVLARAAGADEVLAVGVKRDGTTLSIEMHRIVASDGHVIALATEEFQTGDPELARKIDALANRVLSNDRPRDGKGNPLPVRGAIDNIIKGISEVSGESVRLVVGISAATLVATGVVMGVMANEKETKLRPLVQTDPRVGELGSSGRSLALAADILVGTGLVTGSVWAWMQFGGKGGVKSEPPPRASPPPPPPSSSPAPRVTPEKKVAPEPKKVPEKKKEPEKKKDDGVWDPWAAQSTSPAWVRPTIGFGHIGLEGGF